MITCVRGRGVLLLDVDGTVCAGDAAILEYARLVDADLAGTARSVTSALEAFLDGTHHGTHHGGLLTGAQDGYQAVTLLAEHFGAPPGTTRTAFLAARARMADGGIPVEAPPGLADVLAELPPSVRVVLVTNAPTDGLGAVVERLGLSHAVDEVVGDAAKPAGLVHLIDRELRESCATDRPWRLLSVGDIWENDLRPALDRGCVAMYVDRFDRRQGPAHARATTLEGLYGHIRRWVSITMSTPFDAEQVHAVYPPFARE